MCQILPRGAVMSWDPPPAPLLSPQWAKSVERRSPTSRLVPRRCPTFSTSALCLAAYTPITRTGHLPDPQVFQLPFSQPHLQVRISRPSACCDWRNWCVASSSPRRLCPWGCWTTAGTPPRCSRSSTMTKVSTILIDTNASISHLILSTISRLGIVFKYILVTMDFPILHLVVEDSSNILGFSRFNTPQPFDLEFVHSLKVSWRENWEASTYPGPAVSSCPTPSSQTLLRSLQASADHAQNPWCPFCFLSTSRRSHSVAWIKSDPFLLHQLHSHVSPPGAQHVCTPEP